MVMKEEISLCGFICGICPAFKQNINSDEDRLQVDKGWKRFHRTKGWVYDEDYCLGCFNVPETPLWSGCPIRKCVMKNNIDNCGYCLDYPCPRINNMIHITNKIAERTKKEGTQEDYQQFGLPFLSKPTLDEIHQNFSTTLDKTKYQPLNTSTIKFPSNISQESLVKLQVDDPDSLHILHSYLERMLTLQCKTPGGQEQELKQKKELLKFLWIVGRYGNLITDNDMFKIEITSKQLKEYLKYGKWRTQRKLEELLTHGIDSEYSGDIIGIIFANNYQSTILLQKYIHFLLKNYTERTAYSKFWKADMSMFENS